MIDARCADAFPRLRRGAALVVRCGADNAATFLPSPAMQTTANALTWILFPLAAQPELQEELSPPRQRIAPARRRMKHGVAHLSICHGSGSFLMESLRLLYPPVPGASIGRRCSPTGSAARGVARRHCGHRSGPWLPHRHSKIVGRSRMSLDIERALRTRAGVIAFHICRSGAGGRICVGAQRPQRPRRADHPASIG